MESLGGPELSSLLVLKALLFLREAGRKQEKPNGDLVGSLGSSRFVPGTGVDPGIEEWEALPS